MIYLICYVFNIWVTFFTRKKDQTGGQEGVGDGGPRGI